MIENVPWAVDAAAHSAQVARTLAYSATSGEPGVVQFGDLAVRATQTPSGQVRVASGAVNIANRYAAAASQMYIGRNVSETLVDIPASGSSGSKTWYVCATVKDPEYPGTQAPSDPLSPEAQYFFFEVLASIPTTRPCEPLAKVVVPANTGTITQAMITDLRKVSRPKREPIWVNRPLLNSDIQGYSHKLRMAKNGDGVARGEEFPDRNNGGEFAVQCPEWASWALINLTWSGVRYAGKNAYGGYYVSYTNATGKSWRSSQDFSWDQLEAGYPYVTTWTLGDQLYIPPEWRGDVVKFYAKAFRDVKSPESAVELTGRSGVSLTGWWIERADILGSGA